MCHGEGVCPDFERKSTRGRKPKNNDIDKTIQDLKTKDMHFLDEAAEYKRILSTGMTQDELAKRLHLRQCTIGNKVRLLKLSPEVQKAIRKSKLTERHARALLKLVDSKHQLKAVEYISEYELSVNEAEMYISKQVDIIVKKGSIKEFIHSIADGVAALKKAGVNIKGGKVQKEGYTDIVVRVYN